MLRRHTLYIYMNKLQSDNTRYTTCHLPAWRFWNSRVKDSAASKAKKNIIFCICVKTYTWSKIDNITIKRLVPQWVGVIFKSEQYSSYRVTWEGQEVVSKWDGIPKQPRKTSTRKEESPSLKTIRNPVEAQKVLLWKNKGRLSSKDLEHPKVS